MTEEKTTRELVYETNRDVKWICRTLRRMEAQDEEFEARIRALEGWRVRRPAEDAMLRQERSVRRPEVFECGRISTVSAGAGGVVGGVVAVIVKVLSGGRTTTGARRAWVPLSLSNPTTGDVPGIQI